MNSINELEPVPSTSKADEKLPLKHNVQQSRWTPFGDVTFFVIVGSFAVITIGITSAVVVECLNGHIQHYKVSGGVVTDSQQCGEIGISLLKSGGSSVDAAVAIMLCLGVTLPHLTGLGGGGFIIIRKGGIPVSNVSIDFLDLFSTAHDNQWEDRKFGVPGVLKGLWLAHSKFGRLSWKEVVQPSAHLALHGFGMEASLYRELNRTWYVDSRLKEVFLLNGTTANVGEKLNWPSLGNSLVSIAEYGEQAFYNGSLTDELVDAMNAKGAKLTREDFANYTLPLGKPLETSYRNFHLLTSSSASGGPPVFLAFRLLQHLELRSNKTQSSYDLQTIVNVVEDAVEKSEKLRQELATGNISMETIENLAQLINANGTSSFNGSKIQAPVGTIAVVSDSQDLHVTIVAGLGTPFGTDYVSSAGIIWSDASQWLQPQFGNWATKLVPVIAVKHNHFCQPVIAAASNDFRRLVTNIYSWITTYAANNSEHSVGEDSVGVIMRSNNLFRSSIDPVGEGFSGLV